MEQSREEFEKWCESEINRKTTFENPVYKGIAWESWQASRAAIKVELPSAYDDAWNDQRMGYNIGIKLCRETIEAQGLTVK